MFERLLTLLFIVAGLFAFQTTVNAHGEGNEILILAQTQPSQRQPSDLQTLSQATGIDASQIGEAGNPGPNYLAYHHLKSQGKALYPQLVQQFPNATAVGQLYLASLIREIDSAKGTQLLTDLKSNDLVITRISGCLLSQTHVGAIATQLLDPESHFSF